MRITDIFLVIPDLVLIIVVAAIFGRHLINIIFIIGIIYWTSTARLIRAQVKSVRERVYVKRTRSLGAGNTRIVFRHVLPQIAPLLIANTVLTVAIAIFDETALSFLGLGVRAPMVSWGVLLNDAQNVNVIALYPWLMLPVLPVIIVVLAFNFMGDGLRDAADPYS